MHELHLLTRERGVRRARSERLSIRPACAGGREVRSGVWTDLLAFSVVTVCRLSGEDRAIVSSTTGMPCTSRRAAVTVRFDRVQKTGRRASTRARKAALSPESGPRLLSLAKLEPINFFKFCCKDLEELQVNEL